MPQGYQTCVKPILGGESRCASNAWLMGSHGKSALGMGRAGKSRYCARVMQVSLYPY